MVLNSDLGIRVQEISLSLCNVLKSNENTMVCVLWSQLVPTVQLVFIKAFSFVVPPGNWWCNQPMVLISSMTKWGTSPVVTHSTKSVHIVTILWWHTYKGLNQLTTVCLVDLTLNNTFWGLHIQKSLKSSFANHGIAAWRFTNNVKNTGCKTNKQMAKAWILFGLPYWDRIVQTYVPYLRHIRLCQLISPKDQIYHLG